MKNFKECMRGQQDIKKKCIPPIQNPAQQHLQCSSQQSTFPQNHSCCQQPSPKIHVVAHHPLPAIRLTSSCGQIMRLWNITEIPETNLPWWEQDSSRKLSDLYDLLRSIKGEIGSQNLRQPHNQRTRTLTILIQFQFQQIPSYKPKV